MLKPSSTTGQRQRKEEQRVSPTSTGRRFPQGLGVSVSDYHAGQPTIPRRRQEVCAGADRPAEHFFFSTGRGAFFLMSLCGAPAAPRAVGRGGAPKPTKWARKCPWGAREQAQFSPQAETELSGLCDDDNGGRIPHGQCPCGSRHPRGRCSAARPAQTGGLYSTPSVEASSSSCSVSAMEIT